MPAGRVGGRTGSAGRVTVRVSLVRHGQTAWNAERKLLGWTDVPLDAV
ncbi:MAG: histidine phosphatase family protein, partial [Acidimicrobiia bacterium]